jgi:23S rRNA pseudouridine1911/1915/1917 synthase
VEQGKRRLARVAQELLASSHAHAKREVLRGHVLVNGDVVTDPGAFVGPEDLIGHDRNLPKRVRARRSPPIEVLHLDADIVVVNKPPGLLVHPTTEGEQDTLVSRTAAELERRTGRHHRVLVVHRLDRETSGVLVLALSNASARRLQAQFRAHTVERRYLALARGQLSDEVLVRRGIGRPRPGARRAALAPGRGGRPARTIVRPIERLAGATLVEAELGTGRTHQVRVHLSYLGHAVLGDSVYGDPDADPVAVARLALHATTLAFVHPTSGQRMEFRNDPPLDFIRALERLRGRAKPARPGPRGSAKASGRRLPRTPRRPAGSAAPKSPGTKRRPRPPRSRHAK